jgi:hypothetical protein
MKSEERKPTARIKRTGYEDAKFIKIKAETHKRLLVYADEKGRLIQAIATEAIDEYLRRNF